VTVFSVSLISSFHTGQFIGPEHSGTHEKYVVELLDDPSPIQLADSVNDPSRICLMCCIQGLFTSTSYIALANLYAALEDPDLLVAILGDSSFCSFLASSLFNCSQTYSKSPSS
jgi:hypothetical protein